jgi:broad specificity phosphatase PhoE
VRTLILARHAHAASNEHSRTSCVPPGRGLSPLGLEQARALGAALAGEPIELGVASELARTQETLAVACPGLPRLVLPALDEIGFGRFEGGPLADYRAWAWAAAPDEPCPGGGESRAAAAARFASALRVLLARSEEVVLAVGHALPIRYVLDAADGAVPAAHVDAVPHAEPYRLDRAAVEGAAATLREWSESPVFRPSQGGRL